MSTLRQAITAHCKECIVDDVVHGTGTWRKQITDCTSPNCNLYPHRPVDSHESNRRKQAKIAQMSPKELEEYKRKGEEFKRNLNKG